MKLSAKLHLWPALAFAAVLLPGAAGAATHIVEVGDNYFSPAGLIRI